MSDLSVPSRPTKERMLTSCFDPQTVCQVASSPDLCRTSRQDQRPPLVRGQGESRGRSLRLSEVCVVRARSLGLLDLRPGSSLLLTFSLVSLLSLFFLSLPTVPPPRYHNTVLGYKGCSQSSRYSCQSVAFPLLFLFSLFAPRSRLCCSSYDGSTDTLKSLSASARTGSGGD